MKRKSLLIMLLMALFAPLAMFGQETLTVCEGTATNQYVPFYGYYADETQQNQMIFPAMRDMNGTNITEMVFDCSSVGSAYSGGLGNWIVSLGETDATTLSGLDNTTALTQVYSGELTVNASAKKVTVTFTTPYLYNGGNLLVEFNHPVAAGYRNIYFYGIEATGAAYTYNAVRNFLPQTTFTYLPADYCFTPSGITAETTPFSATIDWNAEADAYNIRYRVNANSQAQVLLSTDFENGLPSDWATIDNDGDGFNWDLSTNVGNFTCNSGEACMTSASYDNENYTALTPDNWLITPQVALGGSISFYACGQDASWCGEHFAVFVSTTSQTDVTTFTQVSDEYEATGSYQEYVVDLGDYSGNGYIAIRHFNCTDMFFLNVDDVTVYGPSTQNPWTTISNVTTKPYTIEGLTPETTYDVEVQAVCSATSSSDWSETAQFTTPSNCQAPANLTATDIDAYSAALNWTGFQDSYNIQYRTAAGRETYYFTSFNTADDREGWTWTGSAIYGFSDPIYGYSASENFFLQMGWATTDEAYIISPELPEYQSGATLEFYYFGYSAENTFQVGYSTTTNETDAFTWGDPITAPLQTYTLYSEVLANGIKYVAFKATAEANANCIFIDDFGIFGSDIPAGSWVTVNNVTSPYTLPGLNAKTEYEWQVQGVNASCDGGVTEWSAMATFTTEPSCLVPTDIESKINDNIAVLIWTSEATLFDIEVNGEVIEGVENPYNLELEPETIYEIRVRANCGGGDYSDWSAAYDFVSDCSGAKELPYEFGFDLADMGEYYACWLALSWSSANNAGLANDPDDDNNIVFRFSSWYQDDDDTYTQILISPELNTEAAVNVQFDYMPYTTSYGNETFTVGYASDFSSLSDFVWAYDIEADDASQWTTFSKNLPAGTKYVALLYTSEYVSHLFIDNFKFEEATPITQTTDLYEGWNRISLYVEVDDPVEMLDMLKESLGENGLNIESTYFATQFEGDEWFGDLDEEGINNEEMYLIEVSADCSIELQGLPADPALHAITIVPGYNRIGFPCTEEVEVAVALADFEAEEGDILESADGQTFYEGEEWFGDIETLVPGQGYLYYSVSDEEKTLVFLTGAKKARSAQPVFGTLTLKSQPVVKVISQSTTNALPKTATMAKKLLKNETTEVKQLKK